MQRKSIIILIEKDKEQISDAWLDGYCANENDVIDSTNYFDTKFGHDVG